MRQETIFFLLHVLIQCLRYVFDLKEIGIFHQKRTIGSENKKDGGI